MTKKFKQPSRLNFDKNGDVQTATSGRSFIASLDEDYSAFFCYSKCVRKGRKNRL